VQERGWWDPFSSFLDPSLIFDQCQPVYLRKSHR